MMEDCVFCKIVAGKLPAEIIEESDNFLVIKNIKPLTKGHALVIPKKHYVTFLDIPNLLMGEFFQITKDATLKLIKETGSSGFNLLMNNFKSGQQEVMHAHLHIVPRKEGDGHFEFLK